MLNNVAIDVFLGLTFVFLLYSLLATIIQEAIAGILNLRAATLVRAIRVMLDDRQPLDTGDASWLGRLFMRVAASVRNQWQFLKCNLPDNSFAKAFYKHPSVKYLSTSSARSKPSYISAANFSSTLVKVLRGRFYDGSSSEILQIYQKLYPQQPNELPVVNVGLIDKVTAEIKPETLDQLRQMYVDANNDIDKFKGHLENWFNETMDRANGWYKRKTKRILFFIGLGVAITGNIDTFKIYHILATNETARGQLVEMAIQSQNKYQGLSEQNGVQNDKLDSTYSLVKQDADRANSILGIGWVTNKERQNFKAVQKMKADVATQLRAAKIAKAPETQLNVHRRTYNDLTRQLSEKHDAILLKEFGICSIFGWIITALALTLGAPFWFDLLNKFISLRSSGAKPTSQNSNLNTDDADTATTQTPPFSVTVNSNATEEEAVG